MPSVGSPRTVATSERETLLGDEIERLNRELAVLDRQWARKHRLALVGLLALPALYFGPMYVVIVLLCTPALVMTQAYLIGVRRSECRELIAEARAELERLRGASGATRSRPAVSSG